MTSGLLPMGTPLFVNGLRTYPIAVLGTLDAREACSEVLCSYLRCAEFNRGGGEVADTSFKLRAVEPTWPDPEKPLDFPTASVIEQGPVPYVMHNLTPTCVEESWNLFAPNTVLWKTDDVVCEFQVDFWTNSEPDRQAVLARLSHLFSPGEERRGVLLSGHPKFYYRTVRAELVDHSRFDNSEDVFQRERRCMAHVRCTIDNVHLRCVSELSARIVLKVDDSSQPTTYPLVPVLPLVPAPVPVVVPAPDPVFFAGKVGMNPSAINYFAPAVPLLNLYQMGEGFRNENAGGSSSVVASYDADGYPNEVPFGIGGLAQKVTQYCAALAYTGHYVCKWDGDGDITIYNSSGVVSSAPNRIVVNVAAVDLDDSLVVQITRSNVADHVRNIRLVHASHEAALDAGEIWHPDFLAKLAGVGYLRFMDWGGTNWSANTTWSGRTTPTQLQGHAYRGVSYELMIDLCNKLGCDGWFPVPHRADDTYCENLAQLIEDNLDPSLGVYVEYSNEVWNNIFSDGVAGPGTHGQSTWAIAQGLALNLDTVGDYPVPDASSDYWAGIKYQARRSCEIFDIFTGILGSRVTRVIGSQAGNSEVSRVILHSLADAAVNPLHANADAACDAIAIAPYFGGGIIDAMYAASAPETADEIFARLAPRVASDTTAMTAAHYAIVHAAGKRLISYEFGQHLVGTVTNAVNDVGLTAALIAANHDPRMLAFYRLIIAAWNAESHDEIISFFSFIAPDSKFGAWGMLTAQDEAEGVNTPKFTAYLEALAA